MTRSDPCPHCGEPKPATNWLCRACWQELPWEHRVSLWDTTSRHRIDPRASSEPVPVKLAKSAAIGWLRQHSSAL
jgi:hypothetical protein